MPGCAQQGLVATVRDTLSHRLTLKYMVIGGCGLFWVRRVGGSEVSAVAFFHLLKILY